MKTVNVLSKALKKERTFKICIVLAIAALVLLIVLSTDAVAWRSGSLLDIAGLKIENIDWCIIENRSWSDPSQRSYVALDNESEYRETIEEFLNQDWKPVHWYSNVEDTYSDERLEFRMSLNDSEYTLYVFFRNDNVIEFHTVGTSKLRYTTHYYAKYYVESIYSKDLIYNLAKQYS